MTLMPYASFPPIPKGGHHPDASSLAVSGRAARVLRWLDPEDDGEGGESFRLRIPTGPSLNALCTPMGDKAERLVKLGDSGFGIVYKDGTVLVGQESDGKTKLLPVSFYTPDFRISVNFGEGIKSWLSLCGIPIPAGKLGIRASRRWKEGDIFLPLWKNPPICEGLEGLKKSLSLGALLWGEDWIGQEISLPAALPDFQGKLTFMDSAHPILKNSSALSYLSKSLGAGVACDYFPPALMRPLDWRRPETARVRFTPKTWLDDNDINTLKSLSPKDIKALKSSWTKGWRGQI